MPYHVPTWTTRRTLGIVLAVLALAGLDVLRVVLDVYRGLR